MKILDMGCGPNKTPSSIGVDRYSYAGVDVLWDLEKFPYPFADNSVDQIIYSHILEHVQDPLKVLLEAARVLKPGGSLVIRTPHFSSMNAYSDLTHLHAFSLHAFKLICSPSSSSQPSSKEGHVHYMEEMPFSVPDASKTPISFHFVQGRLRFPMLHKRLPLIPARWVGLEWLANSHPIFYERFLAFLCPADEINVTLEVQKNS